LSPIRLMNKTNETDYNNNNLGIKYPGSFLSRISNEPGLE